MRGVLLAAAAVGMSACASGGLGGTWTARTTTDKFTDQTSCRVMYGSEYDRAFGRQLFAVGIAYYFMAENRAGDVRVGITAEPQIPIAGEVQLRVDQNPYITLNLADTPIDSGGSYMMPNMDAYPPELKAQMEANFKQIGAMASPYRVVTGEKAKAVLNQIVAGKILRWRVVGVNQYLSSTGEVKTTGLAQALAQCAIPIEPPAATAPAPAPK